MIGVCVCVTLLRACAGAARARAGRVRVGGVDAAPGTGDECAGWCWCETAGERDATALGERISDASRVGRRNGTKLKLKRRAGSRFLIPSAVY